MLHRIESGGDLLGPNAKLGSGQLNQIPKKDWPFAGIAAPYRVREKPMPWWGWPWTTCPNDEDKAKQQGKEIKDGDCDWWREKIHRNMAWLATTIAGEYKSAAKALMQVPHWIDVAQWYKMYLVPLKNSVAALNAEVGSPYTADRFYSNYAQPECSGKGFCQNNYYPRQYWADMVVLMEAHIMDLENTATIRVANAEKMEFANLSPKEMAESVLKGETPKGINWGESIDFEQVLKDKGIGGGIEYVPVQVTPPATLPGGAVGQTPTTPAEAFNQALMSEGTQTKINPTTIALIGGGLLVALLAFRRK